jgi:hypothetical protein
MKTFRCAIEPIVEKNSYTLDMPLKFHALRRARGCISEYGDVNTRNRLGDVHLLTALCGAPDFDEFRSPNMRSAKGPIQKKNQQIAS